MSCNSTYRLRYWNGIPDKLEEDNSKLQQYLPFTVLKPFINGELSKSCSPFCCNSTYRLRYWNEKLLNVTEDAVPSCNSTYRLRYWNTPSLNWRTSPSDSCNSTYRLRYWNSTRGRRSLIPFLPVATVLTVYGIETYSLTFRSSYFELLQQYLPFTVLKLTSNSHVVLTLDIMLQQCLPFTVLKQAKVRSKCKLHPFSSCNSTYRYDMCYRLWSRSGTAQRWDSPIAVIYTDWR